MFKYERFKSYLDDTNSQALQAINQLMHHRGLQN